MPSLISILLRPHGWTRRKEAVCVHTLFLTDDDLLSLFELFVGACSQLARLYGWVRIGSFMGCNFSVAREYAIATATHDVDADAAMCAAG
jgi:hypothetical protein